jgi:hypothetical protein
LFRWQLSLKVLLALRQARRVAARPVLLARVPELGRAQAQALVLVLEQARGRPVPAQQVQVLVPLEQGLLARLPVRGLPLVLPQQRESSPRRPL